MSIPPNIAFSKCIIFDNIYTITMKKQIYLYTLIALAGLTVIAIIMSFSLSLSESFRLVFGSAFMLFLPGFVLTWIFWDKGEISHLERFMLSLVFSIAIVPLFVFLLNKIGILITTLNIFIIVSGIIITEGLILLFQNKRLKHQSS